jgi:hypothetical protein
VCAPQRGSIGRILALHGPKNGNTAPSTLAGTAKKSAALDDGAGPRSGSNQDAESRGVQLGCFAHHRSLRASGVLSGR